jgi:hypothetical protein
MIRFLAALFSLLFSFEVFAQASPGAIFSGENIKLLKESLVFKDTGVRLMAGDTDDPTSVAKSAQAGSIYLREGTAEVYVKTDNGSSTNWSRALVTGNLVPLASGGTNKNTVVVPGGLAWTDANSYEIGAAGTSGQAAISGGTGAPTWFNPAQYSFLVGGASGALATLGPLTNGQLLIGSTGASAVAAALTGTANQVTVTVGAGSITISLPQDLDTGADLTLGSLALPAKTAGRCAFYGTGGLLEDDAGCEYDATLNDITLDGTVTGQTIQALGNVVADNGVIGSYLEANSTTEPSTPCPPVTTDLRNAMTPNIGGCVFDTDAKTTLYYDGTNWSIQGASPNVTNWETVTVTSSWVTNTTITAKRMYIGPSVIYDILVETSGAPTSASLTITLADTIDSSAMASTAQNVYNNLGESSVRDEGVANYVDGGAYYGGNGSNAIIVSYKTGTTSATDVTQAAPITFGASDKVKIRTKAIPVVGRPSSIGHYSVQKSLPSQQRWTNVSSASASTASGSFTTLTDADFVFANRTSDGSSFNVQAPGNNGDVAMKRSIPAAPGYWHVGFVGALYAAGSVRCSYRLVDTTNSKEVGPFWLDSATGSSNNAPGFSGLVYYSGSDNLTNVEWKLQARTDFGAGSCQVYSDTASTSAAIFMKPDLEFGTWLAKDVVSTPGIQTSASVIQSAEISATGSILRQTGSWVSSCTNANPIVCTISGFTAAPFCTLAAGASGGPTTSPEVVIARVDASTTTSVSVHTYSSAVGSAQGIFTMTCHGY